MSSKIDSKENRGRLAGKEIIHLAKMTKKVYRERGFTSLILRIIEYIKGVVGFYWFCLITGPVDVLYVSGCPGGSKLYRCDNQAEELKLYGIRAGIVSQNNFILARNVKKFKVFIFQRVVFNKHLKAVLKTIKLEKRTVIFETDDLVFNPEYFSYMYHAMTAQEKKWYLNGIGREFLEDPYIKDCVVSTDYLKEAMLQKYPRKQVFVSYNKLNRKQIQWANQALLKKNKIKIADGKIRIGYFSGSKSHNKDFDVVKSALLKILQENKNAILVVVGYLELNSDFEAVKSQIEIKNFVSLKKLANLILSCDINLAPLEITNPFCQAKSGLKFFEAGILEIPTVATATGSFKRLIENGKNGFLAEDESDWYKSLTSLVKDEKLRERIGKMARKDALEKHTTQKKHPVTEKYAEFLKSKIQ